MNYSVKLFALLFFFCVDFLFVEAQQKHFIYIQSQDQQPFAIVMEGKVYSSSDYGYVIISKLPEGAYNFTVSFPLNKFPDQQFTCTIDKKDAGYFLKNDNDAWALENMQTKKLIVSSASAAKANDFGNMLSDVVSDSSLTKSNTTTSTVNQPNADGAAAATAIVAGATVAATSDNANSDLMTDSLMQPQKIAETKLDTGTNLMFVDKTQSGVDTISAFIPSEETNNHVTTDTVLSQASDSEVVNNTQNTNAAAASSTANNDVPVPAATTPATETAAVAGATVAASANSTGDVSNPFYKPGQNNNNSDSNNVAAISAEPNNQPSNQTSTSNVASGVKSDCDNMLSDDDLNKLKRKMFVQKNNSDMIQYAVKFLKNKCITTDQVKTLGYLFSSDDGRYNLYDAVYGNVYDYSNYPQLENSILDPYYKKRFAAMLR